MISAVVTQSWEIKFLLVATFIASIVGLILAIAAMKHRGLNGKCGASAVILFIALMIASAVGALQYSGGVKSPVAFYSYAVAACLNLIGGVVGCIGFREMRRRRKWQRGSRRAIASVTTHIVMLGTISTYYYLRLNPHIVDNFLNG